MVQQHKRSLENGKSSQPAKYLKRLDCNLGQMAAVVESVPIQISQKICFPVYEQPGNLHNFCGEELLSSSSITNHGKFDTSYDGVYWPEQEDADEESVEIETDENDVSPKDTLPVSVIAQNDIIGRHWQRSAATSETESVNSQNIAQSRNHEPLRSRFSIPVKEVVKAELANTALGGSILSEDGCQTHEEIVSDAQQVKMETCTSVSSVDNSSRPRVSKDLDLDLVSASSLGSENTMCDSETLDMDCRGLVNTKEHSLPPVCERGALCFPAYPEVDYCADQRYPRSELTAGIDGFAVEHGPCKKVPIGAEFQAEIPICRSQSEVYPTGCCDEKQACRLVHTNDDDKYSHSLVGDHVWPLLGSNGGLEENVIGQGRSGNCSCPDQGSTRCVKEHIEAEREKLKLKLGEAFYLWRFDDMGESVSEKWTRKEEHSFWELARMNPTSSKTNFWDYLSVAFPSRSKMELVSYYFNVFVLRRRALQNRFAPDNIDSDDDETVWHDSEIETNCRLMTQDDDDSGTESDATGDDDEVAESDATGDDDAAESDATGDDDEVAEATEYDEVAASYMLEEDTDNRSICNISFGGTQNEGMDSQEEDADDVSGGLMPTSQHRLTGTHNCSDLMEEQDLQDESCMSYEWNHETKSSAPLRISSAAFCSSQQEKIQKATNFDHCHKEEKQLAHCGKSVLCENTKENGFSSCKEEFVMDGHSLLEPCDSKLWDVTLVASLQTDVDRLVSTCSMIKELFGDEARENENLRNNTF